MCWLTGSLTMKKPRFDDFPTITEQPKPAKELHSSLDEMPAISAPPNNQHPPQPELPSSHSTSPSVRTDERPYGRTPVRRTITRYAFEFFADQLDELKHLSLEEKMQGKKGSMSEMVREAIDAYLHKRRQSAA